VLARHEASGCRMSLVPPVKEAVNVAMRMTGVGMKLTNREAPNSALAKNYSSLRAVLGVQGSRVGCVRIS
jgi:hypothetical protein